MTIRTNLIERMRQKKKSKFPKTLRRITNKWEINRELIEGGDLQTKYKKKLRK